MTATVMTVGGPRPVDQLGVTLPHEHLFIDMFQVNRNIQTILDDPVRMVFEVLRFKDAGGGTLVDVTPRNVGRRPDLLRRVADETGVNVIMGTGWYRAPWYESVVAESSVDACAELLSDEISYGDTDHGVRPGIIGEIGTDDAWIAPIEERGFRAAARAQRRTGVTITTHAFGSNVGCAQLDLLAEEGVAPGRVIIGHCDTFLDDDYLDALLRRGAWVQMDTIRVVNEWDFTRRAATIKRIVERGFGHQLLLSQDACFRDLLKSNGGPGLTCLIEDFLPFLARSAGLDEEIIRRLTVDNPQRALWAEPVPW